MIIFRKFPGAYNKAINSFKLFNEANFLNSIRITTSVCKRNIDDLEEMYNTFLSLGIENWRLLSVEPIGRASKNDDILLDKKELIQLLDFVKKKRKTQKNIKIVYGCAGFLGDEYEYEVRNNFFYCRTGISIASILYNGDIFVCPNVPRHKDLIQGNIKTDSISKCWNDKFKIFREENRTSCDECRACDNWSECKGGSFHSWDFDKKCQNSCFMRDKIYK